MKHMNKQSLVMSLIALFLIPATAMAQRGNSRDRNQTPQPNRKHRTEQRRQPQTCAPAQKHYRPYQKKRVVRQRWNHRPRGMHPATLNHLVMQLNRTGFDSERLRLAKMAIRHNGASTQQVIRLMNELTFDRNRLELASFAYHHVIDPRNFFMAAESLTFYSNRRRLMRMLR